MKSIFDYGKNEFTSKKIYLRMVFTVLMIVILMGIVYSGPMGLMLLALFSQVQIFYEITDAGMNYFRMHEYAPYGFAVYGVINYWTFAQIFYSHFQVSLQMSRDFAIIEVLKFLQQYHVIISYSLYTATFVNFIWTVKREKVQHSLIMFSLFNMASYLTTILLQSAYTNINNGLIWFLIPIAMVIVNDCAAYIVGLNFGKTQLIQVSPKKTVEGYLGAILPTIMVGFILTRLIISYPRLVCPVVYNFRTDDYDFQCSENELFIPIRSDLFGLIEYNYYPVYAHILVISCFVSIIGPFGGFFSSAFKRAFDLKDYSNLIPGHGGLTDRFDCQVYVQIFVYAYYVTFIHNFLMKFFIRNYKSMTSVNQLIYLKDSEKIKFFEYLTRNYLCQKVDKLSLLAILGDIYPSTCYK